MPPTVPAADSLPADSPDLHELLSAQLSLIDRVIRRVCLRNRFHGSDADDFAGHVLLRLVEDDYGILRKYEGRGTLELFLDTVIQNLLYDFRIALWGRWRPSAESVRRGRTAVLLDQLLTRDRLTFDQAVEIIRTNYQIDASRDELYEMSLHLPVRTRLRLVSNDTVEPAAPDGQPDLELDRAETAALAASVRRALKEALRRLPPDDRRLLEMRFREGRKVRDIARALGVDARPLYRRIDRIVGRLRRPLAIYRDALAWPHADLDVGISW